MSTIKISDIETILNKIIKRLKEEECNEFSFAYDEYWIISTDEWSNFDSVPKPLVGSLNDDINFLRFVIEENLDASYLELERIASILRAISEALTGDVLGPKGN
jgi:hypothetical protein